MATTRIFVRNLPPTVTEEDFTSHFAKRYAVTDVKLLAQRRIGYVGFRTVDDAAAAVKYFNKSYLRMSRIGVELVDDTRLNPRHVAPTAGRPSHASLTATEGSLKRKRSNNNDSVLKLHDEHDHPQEKAKKTTQTTPSPPGHSSTVNLRNDEPFNETTIKDQPAPGDKETAAPPPTDQDWIRSRTSRLLGLVEDDDDNEEHHGHRELSATSEAAMSDTGLDRQAATPQIPQQPTPPPDHVGEKPLRPVDETLDAPEEAPDGAIEEVRKSRRLFLRNLPYTTSEDDIRELFQSYGNLQEAHVPIDTRSSVSKGIAFVLFDDPIAAIGAFRDLDGSIFQGRLLHILPAAVKRENKLDDFAVSQLPLKKQKLLHKRAEASTSTFNWNSLFMNTDAVITSVSERLGIAKSELIDPTSSDAAVKQAQAETHVIQETKSYFEGHGIDLNAFSKRARGDTALLVKNFPYGTSTEELKTLFTQYGSIQKVLVPPSGTIGIIQFDAAPDARKAFGSLAYRKFKDSVLFLEKAPKDLFKEEGQRGELPTQTPTGQDQLATVHQVEPVDEEGTSTSTIFVKNLNFSTTQIRFYETFQPLDGLVSARVKTKSDPKRPGEVLSMGFGFLEFRTSDQATAALKAMNGYELDGHQLLLKASHKGNDAAQERRTADNERKKKNRKSKIIIKNLPFEASKKDVRDLFKSYGQLRAVRVPKKFDSSRKGFAFAEFTTPREAESAIEALRNTHLLGRRLVLDFAAGETEDPEKEIEKMQRKVGNQSDNMALRKLTQSSERKKFVADEEDDGGE